MDLRKERTLKYLSESLFDLMLEKRYVDITVAEICDKAMVRRATFYRHFSGKDDLLGFVIRSRRKQIKVKIDPDDSLPLRDFCLAMTSAFLDFIDEHQVLLRKASSSLDLMIITTLFSQEISGEFRKHLESESSKSDFAIENVCVLADFYASGLVGAIEQIFLRGEEFKKEKVLLSFQEIFDRLFVR